MQSKASAEEPPTDTLRDKDVTAGVSYPLGATVTTAGANFSLFSRSATRVELLFFDRVEDPRPSRITELNPRIQRTYHYWHLFVPGALLSLGVPMILMGDEARRTQGGNNNAYCQDNETSWFDWTLLEKHADVHRFVKLLTARRLLRSTEHEIQRMSLNGLIGKANKAWYGVRLNQPDWSDQSHSVALTGEIRQEKLLFHLILNAYWEPLDFELPPAANDAANLWRRWIDTAQETPNDIVPWQEVESSR